jgi:hypothetical protein
MRRAGTFRAKGYFFCGQDGGTALIGLRIGTQNFDNHLLAGYKRLSSFLSALPCACQNRWAAVLLRGTMHIILPSKKHPLTFGCFDIHLIF